MLRCRFLDMGLIPHTKVMLEKVAPMGDPIQIQVRGYELTLRKEDAHNIQVERI
jgi:Fe2+ transport system protein FeoA